MVKISQKLQLDKMLNQLKWFNWSKVKLAMTHTAQKVQSILIGYSRSNGNVSFNGLTRQRYMTAKIVQID